MATRHPREQPIRMQPAVCDTAPAQKRVSGTIDAHVPEAVRSRLFDRLALQEAPRRRVGQIDLWQIPEQLVDGSQAFEQDIGSHALRAASVKASASRNGPTRVRRSAARCAPQPRRAPMSSASVRK